PCPTTGGQMRTGAVSLFSGKRLHQPDQLADLPDFLLKRLTRKLSPHLGFHVLWQLQLMPLEDFFQQRNAEDKKHHYPVVIEFAHVAVVPIPSDVVASIACHVVVPPLPPFVTLFQLLRFAPRRPLTATGGPSQACGTSARAVRPVQSGVPLCEVPETKSE